MQYRYGIKMVFGKKCLVKMNKKYDIYYSLIDISGKDMVFISYTIPWYSV